MKYVNLAGLVPASSVAEEPASEVNRQAAVEEPWAERLASGAFAEAGKLEPVVATFQAAGVTEAYRLVVDS